MKCQSSSADTTPDPQRVYKDSQCMLFPPLPLWCMSAVQHQHMNCRANLNADRLVMSLRFLESNDLITPTAYQSCQTDAALPYHPNLIQYPQKISTPLSASPSQKTTTQSPVPAAPKPRTKSTSPRSRPHSSHSQACTQRETQLY